MSELSIKTVASTYHVLGYVVIPFKYGKDDKGNVTKKPTVLEWKSWQTNPQTDDDFAALDLMTCDGFGLLTGIPNKDGLYLGAIDYDIKDEKITDEAKALGKYILDNLPVTKTDRTQSGGLHKYYLSHEPVTTDKNYKNSAALEFLGLGALVYVEPSKGYTRVNDNDFTILNDLQTVFYEALEKHGLGLKRSKEKTELQTVDENEPVTADLTGIFDKNMTLKDTYLGNWKKYNFTSRSEAEQFIITEFMRYGLNPARIRELMQNSKVGKWNDPKTAQQYQDHSMTKAANFIKKEALKPHLQAQAEEQKQTEPPAVLFDAETEERIKLEVQRILDADNQLQALAPHLDMMAIGEDNTKKTLCVLLLSSKEKNAESKQIIILKAESGAGKSTLIRKLIAGYKVKEVGRFSEHALDYSNLSGFDILVLKELGSMDEEKQGVSTIKFLSSDDRGYNVEITSKNKDTGRFETETYKIPAMTVVSSTTRLILDPQFERRAWPLGLDESALQTERIRDWKSRMELQNAEKLLGLRKVTDYEFSSEVYKRFVEKYEPKTVIIPFPKQLLNVLGSASLRIRGDFDKLLNFTKLYATLNLKRLQEIKENVYVLSPEVAVEGLRIALEPLSTMLSRVDKRARAVFDTLKEIYDLETVHGTKGEDQHEIKIQYDCKNAKIDKKIRERIAVSIGKSEKTVRNFFSELENAGYLSGDQKKPKTFTLLYDVVEIEKKVSGLADKLKSDDNLITEMTKAAQEWSKSELEIFFLRTGNKKSETNTDVNQGTNVLLPSAGEKISNPSLILNQPALAEIDLNNRPNQKLQDAQDDNTKESSARTRAYLIPCPICKSKGKEILFCSDIDLENHLAQCHNQPSYPEE